MKNASATRRLLSALLLLVLVMSLCPTALAGFASGQYYQENTNLTKVCTVQVSATKDWSGAEKRRSQMLNAGYDSFIYEKSNGYYIMCGKFRNYSDAEYYLSSIKANTDRAKAYITNAYLSESAIQEFENAYWGSTPSYTPNTPAWNPPVTITTPTPTWNQRPELRLSAYSYTGGQYFDYDPNQTRVFSVQVATLSTAEEAGPLRDKMLSSGYDSFVYQADGQYRVMCGKFRVLYDALCYGESIHANTNRSGAYVNNAYLPEYSIQSFERTFYSSVTINPDSRVMETFWEQPTGDFYRGNTDNTVTVYTIQFSAGTSFHGVERNRDKMINQGYPAFVYKIDLAYMVMTGMFYDLASAQQYCEVIKKNTDQKDAYVTTANLPAYAVSNFQNWWY